MRQSAARSTPSDDRASASATFRLGVVGIDSSHFPEFTRRIATLADEQQTRCRVTRYWTDGEHRMPAADVAKWRADAEAAGVAPADSLEQMLDEVDGVMVLSVDGRQHLAHAMPALQRGLPTYIDKPLACTLADARQLHAVVQQHGGRCYSASSLRFAGELEQLDRDALGELVAVDAFGPGELNNAMPRFLFYGIHAVEMVDAIWGPGVQQVRAWISDDRDLLDLAYRDGRLARVRLERRGGYAFGAVVHGTKSTQSFHVDFAPIYSRLVRGMTHFFEGGPAPVELSDTVENIATLEAAQQSMAQAGAWIDVPR